MDDIESFGTPSDVSGWGQFFADAAASTRQITEDIRRAVAGGEAGARRGLREGYAAPLGDSQLNFVQRTWIYASDQEKMFIVLAIAGVALAAWPLVAKTVKV